MITPRSLCHAALLVALPFALRAADETAPAYTEILKIDSHSHIFEDSPRVNDLLRRINVRTINVCNNGTDAYLEQMHGIAVDLYRKYPTHQRTPTM
jgi:hypothetical protein